MKSHSLFNPVHLALIVAISLAAILSASLYSSRVANAAPVTDFNAGYIIDDGLFYNKNAMSLSQIQSFLNNLTPSCYPYGQNPAGGFNPPYVCLKDYYENPNTGETSFERGLGSFAGSISAAQIIYSAAQQYNINPQVLLVMLKKESLGPLTADTWPVKTQYKYAMGYACPDSGPNYSASCDANKAGFYKQVMLAAWQLNYYKEHSNDYSYHLGWNNIQYSTSLSCGTKSVYIENMATLSLYIYTPYTPNDAALAAYPGTAPCGAYGNRNFFQYFKEWFGSPVFSFKQPTKKTTLSGDFNGDGKSDITLIYYYGDGQTRAWTLYGNGTGFSAPTVTWDSGKWNFDADRATWTTGDFNGDGKTDITALYNYGVPQVRFWTFTSTGNHFSAGTMTY